MKKGLFFLFALLATFGLASCNSADVQSNKEKIAENQTKIAELNTAITTLQTKLEAADSELTKSIAKQIEDLKSELVTADSSAKAALEKEISDLKAAQTSLANDLTTKTAQLKDTIDQKVAELGKDHDDLSKELTDKVAELNQKIETADNTVKTALETELNTLKEALEAVDATLATKEYVDTVKSGLEDSATALGNRVDTLEADPTTKAYVDGKVQELQASVTGLAEVYETITNVAAAKQVLEAADTALDARITALENGSATKEDVDDLNEALDTLAALAATLATKEEVTTQVTALQTAITDLANVYETIAKVSALKTALEAADAAMLERLDTLEAADEDFGVVANKLDGRLAAIETLLTGQDTSISEVFATINTKLTTLEATVATLADAAELKAAINRLDVLEALTGEEAAVYLEKEVADEQEFAAAAGHLYVLEGTEYVLATEFSGEVTYFEKVESIKVYYDAQIAAISDKLGDPGDELATYDENFVYQSGTLFGRIKAVEDRWANFNSDAVANKKAENVKKLTTIYTNFDNEMSELRAISAERLAKETALAYAGNENYDSLEIKALLDVVFARIENEWKHMMEVYLFEGTTKIILAEQCDYFVKAGDGLATDEAIEAFEDGETEELVYLAEGANIQEIDRIYYVYRDLLNSFNDEAKFTVEKEITKASISKFVYLQADHIAYTHEEPAADTLDVIAVIKEENKNTVTLNTILTNVLAVNYKFSESGSTTAQKKAYYDGKIAELNRWLRVASTLNETYKAEENSKKLVEAITNKVEYTEILPAAGEYLTPDEYTAAKAQYGEVYVPNGNEYVLSEAYAESTHYYYATTTGYLTESDKNAIFALYDTQILPANYLAFALSEEVQYTELEPATGDYLTSDEYTAAKAQYGEVYIPNGNEYVLSEAYAESTRYYVEKTLQSVATTDKDLMDLCVRRAYGFNEAKIYAVELKAQVAALQNLSAAEKEALAARIDVVIDNYAELTAADAPEYEINLNQVVTELELENPTEEAIAEYEGARLTFDRARMNLYFEQALEYDRIVGYAKATVTTIASFDEISNDLIKRTVDEQEVEKTSNTWFKELINSVPNLEKNYKKDFVLGTVVVTEDDPDTPDNEKVTRDETLAEATARIKGMLADANLKSVADLQYADDKAEVDLYAQEATAYKDLIVASTEAINAINAYKDNNVETIANPLILDFAKDGMDTFAEEVADVRVFDNYYKEFTLEDVEVTDNPDTTEVESGTRKETHAEAIERLTKAIEAQLGAAGTNDPKATSTDVDIKADGKGDKELVAALVYKARTYWTMLNYVDDCNEVLDRVYNNETYQDIKDEISRVQALGKNEYSEVVTQDPLVVNDLYAEALLACASIADDEATTEVNEAKSLRTVVDKLAAEKGANIDALIERVNVYMDLYYYTRVSETEVYERVQVGSYFFPVAEDNWNQYANAKTELWTLDFTGVNSNDLSEDSFYKKFYYTEVSAGICAVATTWDPEHINYYRVEFGNTVGNEENLDFTNNKYYVRFDNFAELKATGNLYKLVDQAYEQVSGSDEYNDDAKYYLRGTTAYYEKPITKATFVADGTLYVLSQDVYTAVTECEFDPAETYYGKATGTNDKINDLENVPAADAKKFINQYEFGRPQGTMKVRYVHVTEETYEQYGGDLLDVTFTQVQTPSQEDFDKLMYYTLLDGVYTLATGEFVANATYYEMYVVSLPVENPDWNNNYYVALSTSLGFLDTFDKANDNLKTVANWRQQWSDWKAAIDLSYYNATKYDDAMAYLADNLIVFEEVNNIFEADFYSGIYHKYNAENEEYEVATEYDENATYYQAKGYPYFKAADVDAFNTLLKACVNVENFLDDKFVIENEVQTTTHESDNTLAKAKADIDLVVTRAVSYNEALKHVYNHLLVFEPIERTVTYEEVGEFDAEGFNNYKQQNDVDLYVLEDEEYGPADNYLGPYMYYKKDIQNISEETFNAGTYHTFDALTNKFVLATEYDANAQYYQVKGEGFTSLRAQDVIEVNDRITSFVTRERYTTLTGTAPQTDDQAIAAELAANKDSIDLVLLQAQEFNKARAYAKTTRDAIALLTPKLEEAEIAQDCAKVDGILDAQDYVVSNTETKLHIYKYIMPTGNNGIATAQGQLTTDKEAMDLRYYHSYFIKELRDRIEEANAEVDASANKVDAVYDEAALNETHKNDVGRKQFIKNSITALGDFSVEKDSKALYDSQYSNIKDLISTYSFFATRENAILTAIVNSQTNITNANISADNVTKLDATSVAEAKAILNAKLINIYKDNSLVTYDAEGNPSFTISTRVEAIEKVYAASIAIETDVTIYLD